MWCVYDVLLLLVNCVLGAVGVCVFLCTVRIYVFAHFCAVCVCVCVNCACAMVVHAQLLVLSVLVMCFQ